MAAENHVPIIAPNSCRELCSCGNGHPNPTVTLCYNEESCEIMAADLRQLFPGQMVALIDDPETDQAAGACLRRYLAKYSIPHTHVLLQSRPHATDQLVAEVERKCKGAALIVSVGSGTINDLGKYSATRLEKVFWTMPTAPSMNGYTSGIAAIQVNGVKMTLPAGPAQRVYASPSVIRSAPRKLVQSGFCDVMAKVVSDIDWQCESMLVSGSYCTLPSALMAEAEASYSEHPAEVGRGDEAAVSSLFRGLLISGVAMSLAGSSAPASGGEHLLSHFLDMREPITGREPELHGLQVGMGILLSAACYNRLRQVDMADLPQTELDVRRIHQRTADRIPDIWGSFANEVAAQFSAKEAVLTGFLSELPGHWEQLQKRFQQVRPAGYFADLFARIGTPFNLETFRLDQEEFRLAALNCRAIRNRITVLDLAAHAGILEPAVEDTLELLCG